MSIDELMNSHKNVLGTTTLHNSMIWFILSVSSNDFTFGFPKRPHTNRDIFFTYKVMIIPLISQCQTLSQLSSTIIPSNKVHHKASPEAYVALKQPPLNRGSTSFFGTLEQSTPFVRYLSHFDYTFEATNLFV